MKKIVFVLLIAATIGGTAFSVSFDIMSYPPPVQGGNFMVDLGLGLRSMGYSNAKWKIPPIFAQVEYALPVNVPISVGGMFTISKYGYDWGGPADYKWRWTDMTFAGRANWHWGLDIDWLDLYTGLAMGYTRSVFDDGGYAVGGKDYGGFFFSAQVGAHFYFTKTIGVMAEFGYPYWLKAGVALKF